MTRRIAVRKILRARGATRRVIIVASISLALSLLGIMIYVSIVPSEVVLMESFVWLIEAFSFGGLALAFKIAASRTVAYRARYEILRLESLAALVVSVLAMTVTVYIAVRALLSRHEEPTPLIVSAYPLLSGVVSFSLERWLRRSLATLKVKLVSVKVIAEKLALDVAFELVGGLAIIVSNLLASPIWEPVAASIMGIYVVYGLYGISKEAALHLIGVVPKDTHLELERRIRRVLRGVSRYNKVRRLKVETYGTFSEVEVWIEAPENISLGEAYFESMRIARELVHRIPEILRALVILVPRRRIPAKPITIEMKLSSELPRSRIRRRVSSRQLSSSVASRPSLGTARPSQPQRAPQQSRNRKQRNASSSP